jgi:hypothetical protein
MSNMRTLHLDYRRAGRRAAWIASTSDLIRNAKPGQTILMVFPDAQGVERAAHDLRDAINATRATVTLRVLKP